MLGIPSRRGSPRSAPAGPLLNPTSGQVPDCWSWPCGVCPASGAFSAVPDHVVQAVVVYPVFLTEVHTGSVLPSGVTLTASGGHPPRCSDPQGSDSSGSASTRFHPAEGRSGRTTNSGFWVPTARALPGTSTAARGRIDILPHCFMFVSRMCTDSGAPNDLRPARSGRCLDADSGHSYLPFGSISVLGCSPGRPIGSTFRNSSAP